MALLSLLIANSSISSLLSSPLNSRFDCDWVDDHAKAMEAVEATKRRDAAKELLNAEGVPYAANARTETLEKSAAAAVDEKSSMRAYLDEHKVSYDVDLNHAGLVELSDKLKEHLKQQKDAEKG